MDLRSEGLERAIELSHVALSKIINGDSGGYAALFSEQDDVSLGNPFGPFARGRQQVVGTLTDAAARYGGGEVIGFNLIASHVTESLACVVEVERCRAKVGDHDDSATIGLRVTSVFRPEGGTWRLVHRHTDPITTPRTSESVLGE